VLDATNASKEERVALRAAKKEAYQQVEAVLKESGDDACVEVRVANHTLYAQLASRKGTVRRLTPKNTIEMIRHLVAEPNDAMPTPASVVHRVLAGLTQPDRQALVINKTRPLRPRMLPSSDIQDRVRIVESATTRMKAISTDLKNTCKTHKEACESTEKDVLHHLRVHDPANLAQMVRLEAKGLKSEYVLRAKPKKSYVKPRDAVNICENVIAEAARDCPRRTHLIVHLQSPHVLSHIYEELSRRLKPTDEDVKVTLTPA
jgi:hypothetical protein